MELAWPFQIVYIKGQVEDPHGFIGGVKGMYCNIWPKMLMKLFHVYGYA